MSVGLVMLVAGIIFSNALPLGLRSIDILPLNFGNSIWAISVAIVTDFSGKLILHLLFDFYNLHSIL